MIDLPGIVIPLFQIDVEDEVGILLFAEFPSTIVISDIEKQPIIKEWADCSEDGKIDRFFYYKVTKQDLRNFIYGEYSHQDLISHSIDGLLHFTDNEKDSIVKNTILSVDRLPNEYKPDSSFYFQKDDGVDTEKIINFFELDSLISENNLTEKIKEISLNRKSETLNIHLKQSLGVGYGTIDTNILGRTLIKIDDFYKDVSLDHLLGKNRGELKVTSEKFKNILPFISTEIYGYLRASFSLLLRPKASEYKIYNEVTNSELIASNVFNLITNSLDIESLSNEYTKFSYHTISSYKELLKEIYELSLNVELNWYSPITNRYLCKDLNYVQANQILDYIEELNLVSEEEFETIGKFRAINCNTGHFTFVNNQNGQFSGYFDPIIRKGSETINFLSLYRVKINRKIIMDAGRNEDKILDKIISFYDATKDLDELPMFE